MPGFKFQGVYPRKNLVVRTPCFSASYPQGVRVPSVKNHCARKSIKGWKDSDSSLVSNENLSETLWPSGWALGQATWAKMTLKLLHLWRHLQKIRTPQPKNFFSSAIY